MKCIVLSGIYETKQTPDDISTCRIPSFNCVVLVSFKNVFIEHLIYSAALAIIVGMIFSRFTGRDPSWIIIAVAFVPDIDLVLEKMHVLTRIGYPVIIHHGDLHNILVLIVFSLLFAAVLRWIGIRFVDGLICSVIGIAAHFFEDALVYNPAYAFLWPIST